MSDPDEIRKRRLRLKEEFTDLFQTVSKILFEEDPIGINFQTNTEEYEPETGTILPRLRGCSTADDVRAVVHDEFVGWFGAEIAGPTERYSSAADRIFAAHQRQIRHE